MKTNLLRLLLLATWVLNAQINVDTQWEQEVNAVFANMDKSRVPHGILLDYAMEFIDVPTYNGVITAAGGPFTTTSTHYVDPNVLGNIYKTLYMGQVTVDTTDFPQLKNHAKRWYQERQAYNQTQQNTLVLGGLYYQYSRIKTTARADNDLIVNTFQRTYSDRFVNGVWQNPYETLVTMAITPPVTTYNKRSFQVVFPSDLFLSNDENAVQQLHIDFEDGQGYRVVPFDSPVSVSYRDNDTYVWKYKLTRSTGGQLESQSVIKIKAPDAGNPQQSSGIVQERITLANRAEITVDIAPVNNGQLRRPLIVAEGFDSGSILNPEQEGGDTTFVNFDNSLNLSGNTLRNLIDPDRNSRQYDIIYVDWVNGTAPLQDNSIGLEAVINWVNANKVGNEPNVLLGQSMGGLIGRYTLARMEQEQNSDHDVRLFIAHDSPMQGANTPIGIQHFTKHLYNEYVSAPILSGLGEFAVPLVLNYLDFWIDLGNEVFNEDWSGFDGYITPSDLLTIQDTPAAVQLNYQWVTPVEDATTAAHDNWQQDFDTMGYPSQSRNVAISNGNECAAPQRDSEINPLPNPLLPGDELVDIYDLDNPDFFGDLLQSLTTALIGVVTSDFGLTIVGALPGSSEWKFDFDIYTTPALLDQNRTVYHGEIEYTKKFLWLVDITHTLTERTKNAPAGYLPYGSYTGGQSPRISDFFFDEDGDEVIPLAFTIVNNVYGFIPTASALDVRRGTGFPNDFDHQRKYGGGTIDYTGLNSEFDNFIVDFVPGQLINNEHISFQPRNGNWLADELDEVANGAFADCRIVCDGESIQGEDVLCTTGVYFIDIPPIGVTTNWAVSDPDAVTIVNTTATDVTLSAVSGYRTTITLTALIDIPNCGGFATITRDIRVGKPGMPSNLTGPSEVETGAMVQYNAGPSEGATSYKWRLPHIFEEVAQFNLFGDKWQLRLPGNTASEDVFTGYGEINGLVQVSGVNDCGEGSARTMNVTHVTGGGGGVSFTDGDDSTTTMAAYPNPTTGLLMIEPRRTLYPSDGTIVIEQIKVFDATMLEQPVPDFGDGKTYAELDMSFLRKGIYIVQIMTNKGLEVKKVVLQ